MRMIQEYISTLEFRYNWSFHCKFKMSVKKQLNLQGIRGIAILAVLGFHFFPNYFPNGYLGVDQFFVLSGFLMCMLLTKTEKLPKFEMISNFYIRRFKRILPLYQLIIFVSLIALYLIFPDTTIEININSAKRAIIFISNQLKTLEDDYFEKLNMAIDIFTHTWSLSVEIQFYLIVPFLFLLPFRIISLTIISIISLFYFYILPSDIAFLNVFARIWQFLIGMIAFIIHQNISTEYQLEKRQSLSVYVNESEQLKCSTNYAIFIRMMIIQMILVVSFPITIRAVISRPLITVMTGIILIFSKRDDIILSNKILAYIGDISYSLYLIHWPISSYCKITGMSNYAILFLFLAVVVSMLIYESFEKWYTKESNIVILILTISLFFMNLGILNNQLFIENNSEGSVTNISELAGSATQEDIARLNHQWELDDQKNLKFQFDNIFGWFPYTGLNQNNTLRIFSFGNSWTVNHAKVMYSECGPRVKEFMRGAISGCEPLYKFPTEYRKCPEFLIEVQQHLGVFKPDYAFHITRSINIGNNYTDDFENDPVYQSILNETRYLVKNIKKKLFILNSIPSIDREALDHLSENLMNNVPKEEIDKKLYMGYDQHVAASKRYTQLVKDCGSKCELIDYYDLFHPNGIKTYRYYDDNGLSYLTGGTHLTPWGYEFVKPFWRDFCNKNLV
ncbi:unnamed protein product [Caenorhabditis angaria]|uniref:Acyl_transf_3 domain-containing protein n=1 Tax=Caenorhabditis angaria TaxID=860376 RepID=A0A9P1IKY2_9PELO|nr:unnamed protein product [Caenorhabditis angaria]